MNNSANAVKMHATAYYLQNIFSQKSTHSLSNVPIQPPLGDSDLHHRYVRETVGHFTDWRQNPRIGFMRNFIRRKIAAIFSSSLHYGTVRQASDIANILEHHLFVVAATEDEYMNQDTLIQRLRTLVHKMHGTRYSQQVNSYNTSASMKGSSSGLSHAWYNENLADPALQMFASSIINSSDHCMATVSNTNNHEFPKGGLSHPFIVNETLFSSNDCSSITTCTDSDGFSNFSASGGTSNLETSSKPICSHLQQQHVDDVEMDLIKYRGCSGTNQGNEYLAGESPQSESSNLLIPQDVTTAVSKVFNNFPGQSSSCQHSTLKNLTQYQPQKLDCQENFQHFRQSYEHCANAYIAQSRSCFISKDEPCCQLQEQKTLKQPQLPSRLLNVDQQFSSESSACLYGSNGAADVALYDSSEVSVEHKILLAYFHYKNSKNPPRDNQISLVKYLHSTVCNNGMCTCEQYITFLMHFDECQSGDCHICWPLKLLLASKLEPRLEFANSVLMDSTVRNHGNSEDILPPTKRLKIEPTFGVSANNNEISDLWNSKMVLPYSPEGRPELQQQPESSFSIYSEVTENNMESFTNAKQDSASVSKIDKNVTGGASEQTFESETISEGIEASHTSGNSYPGSNDVIARNCRENVSRSNSSIHTFRKDPGADIDNVQGRSGFNQTGENTPKKVIEPKADLGKATESSYPIISGVSYGAFEHNFESETFSLGLEAGHVLDKSYPKSDDVIARNSRDNVGRSNPSIHTFEKDPRADIEGEQDRVGFNQTGKNTANEVIKRKTHLEKETESLNRIISDVSCGAFEQAFKSETISEDIEAGHTLEDSYHNRDDVNVTARNPRENVGKSNSSIHAFQKDTSADIEDVQGRNGFNQTGKNTTRKVIEPKSDLEKGKKSSNPIISCVSLAETFTYNQIREHIMSLRQGFGQSTLEEEKGIGVNSCPLCGMDKLFFAPVPIYCLSCGNCIKRNANFYCRRAEEFDTEQCFCTSCFKNSRGGSIKFNGVSISKAILHRKRNDDVIEEAWAQCDKCKMWQHQICALFNNKRNLEGKLEYVCPRCCLKEIENGIRIPLPETAIFGAKDLPKTKLSDHIEQRLFTRLEQERAERAKIGGKNVDEILGAENLTVRVVVSVEKKLKVKKQFLDILREENYPAEFPYRSKVILLFQKIEGVDICIYGMYVQEFGSDCGYPNRRCVYISYLDSVKHFRPQRETVTGEALRTFVYHEILIGYLEFCKKRGFEKCYIWACPPIKGEDYVLYCHPQSQKTPKSDKLRHWYHSMLRKATEENIVVGFTNIYDHFFVPAGKCDSKVTAARLPYFDGDYWSGAAMDLIGNIEQESKGAYERKVKKVLTKRALKAMGHTNPSKGTTKDILVMQKLGQTILPVKEDFMIVHLQYACTHCHGLILSGKRWFCGQCKKYQECERCHSADTHISISGEKHTLCQVVVDDIPCDTKENDIILDNDLFENRHNFLSFCQQNQFQFDTLRRAKHSSMMILYHLKIPTLLTGGTTCSICNKDNVFQLSWQCEFCPQLSICSACYEEKGANCHEHKLRQCSSTAHCRSGNQGLKQKTVLTQKLLEVLQHASRCHSTISQPCSYPNCLQIKKLFSHASRCTVRASGGCRHCEKAWLGLSLHSRNCRDSECRIPRCMDLKKHAEWLVQQSESRRRAVVVGSARG